MLKKQAEAESYEIVVEVDKNNSPLQHNLRLSVSKETLDDYQLFENTTREFERTIRALDAGVDSRGMFWDQIFKLICDIQLEYQNNSKTPKKSITLSGATFETDEDNFPGTAYQDWDVYASAQIRQNSSIH